MFHKRAGWLDTTIWFPFVVKMEHNIYLFNLPRFHHRFHRSTAIGPFFTSRCQLNCERNCSQIRSTSGKVAAMACFLLACFSLVALYFRSDMPIVQISSGNSKRPVLGTKPTSELSDRNTGNSIGPVGLSCQSGGNRRFQERRVTGEKIG